MIAVLEQQPVTDSQRLLTWPSAPRNTRGNGEVANGIRQNTAVASKIEITVAWEQDRWNMLRLAGGDERALESLMRRHARKLFIRMKHMVRNHCDAKELVNEAFVRVYRHRLRYNCESPFSTWLYVIGSRLAINLLRWRSRHPEFVPLPDAANNSTTDLEALVDPGRIPSEQAESDEWNDALSEALAKLPEQLKVPLLLIALDGCSQAEVAERLGCTVKAVETRLYHGRKRLRTELENILSPWRFRVKAALRVRILLDPFPTNGNYDNHNERR